MLPDPVRLRTRAQLARNSNWKPQSGEFLAYSRAIKSHVAMLDHILQNICTIATPQRPSLPHKVPLQSVQGDVLRMSPPTPTTANYRIRTAAQNRSFSRRPLHSDLVNS